MRDTPEERPILFKGEMVNAIRADRKTQTRRVVKHKYPQLWRGGYYPTGKVLTGLENQPGAFMEFRHEIYDEAGYQGSTASYLVPCPYGKPGDRLWVRETCRAHEISDQEARDDTYKLEFEHPPYGLDGVIYQADGQFIQIENSPEASEKWADLYHYRGERGAKVPSIHMPRWASRITLEITDVRVERLNDISHKDANAEGVQSWIEGHNRGETYHPNGQLQAYPVTAFSRLWQSINGPDSWDANPWVWVVEFKQVTA